MIKPPIPSNEAERLAALHAYEILDTEPEAAFDDLTQVASYICGTPMSVISLVDAYRQWFKSRVGVDDEETSRDIAFCAHAINEPEDLFIVEDALADERFVDNPLVTTDPKIRFYAAMPLVTPEGYPIGMFCVMDHVPRDLNDAQRDALRRLGRQVVDQLELRRAVRDMQALTTEKEEVESHLRSEQERYELAIAGTNDGLWDWDIVTNDVYYSPRFKSMIGYEDDELPNTFATWRDNIHPDDLESVMNSLNAYLEGKIPKHEIEFRMRHKDGSYRWILGRGRALRDENGRPYRMAGSHTDITERKETEEALRRQQEQYELAVTGSNDGIWDWDVVTNDVYYSPRFKSMIGYEDDELPNTFATWRDNIHPDDLESVMNSLNAYLEGKIPKHEIEFRMRHKDGSYRWILGRGRALRDENGRPYRMAGSHTDITERRQSEEALRESEARAQTIFESVSIPMQISRLEDGKYLYVNQLFVDLLGESIDTLIDRHSVEFYYDADERIGLVDQLSAHGKVDNYELRIKHSDGEPLWVLLTARTVNYLGEAAIIATLVDITERRQVEEALRDSEARAQGILESVTVPMLISRVSDSQILYANRQLAHVVRILLDEPTPSNSPGYYMNRVVETLNGLRQPGTYSFYADIADREQVVDIIRSQGRVENYELLLRRIDGEEFWALLTAQLIQYDGELAVITTLIDISERKQVEATIQEREAQLQAILSNLPLGVFVADAKTGAPQLVNEAGIELLGRGMDPNSGADAYTEVYQTYRPDSDDLFPAEELPLVKTMMTGEIHTGQVDILRPETGRITVDVVAAPVQEADGEIRNVMALFQDVTEQKITTGLIAKQARDLQAVAEVSTAVATLTNEQELLQRVSDLTKERFGLYHAHVYLLDDIGQTLILKAGAGEIGRKMVSEGRRIAMAQAQSLVAQAARQNEGVIVNNVQANPSFLPNPLLPETRSEMAVPIRYTDQVLGVLDVQAATVNYFMEEDARVLTTLATQIGIALQNARSLEVTERAVAELNQLTRRLTREGWVEFVEKEPAGFSYSYDLQEVNNALALATTNSNASSTNQQIEQALAIQGEPVGFLTLDDPQILTEDASDIMAEVAERLSLHLESLRLTEQTQQALAETADQANRLATLNQMATELNNATEMDDIFTIATEYARQIVNCERSSMTLLTEDGRLRIFALEEGGVSVLGLPSGSDHPLQGAASGAAIEKQQMIVLPNVAECAYPRTQALAEHGIQSMVIMPLMTPQGPVGTLNLGRPELAAFTNRDISLIRQISSILSATIENRRLIARAQARAERERRVRDITDKIRRGGNREAILATARDEIAQLLGTKRALAQVGNADYLLQKLGQGQANVAVED